MFSVGNVQLSVKKIATFCLPKNIFNQRSRWQKTHRYATAYIRTRTYYKYIKYRCEAVHYRPIL